MSPKTTEKPLTPAERMRLHRKRRRNGLRFMRILLHETEIDALIRKGFLKRERRQDQHAVQNAIDGFICNELGPADALLRDLPPDHRGRGSSPHGHLSPGARSGHEHRSRANSPLRTSKLGSRARRNRNCHDRTAILEVCHRAAARREAVD